MEQNINPVSARIAFVQNTLSAINGKWKLPVLMSVHAGINRFRDIQRNIPNITTRVLSKELKELEANNLIARNVKDAYPVSITYALTSYSHTLTPVVDEMIKWGKQHTKRIEKKGE